LFVILIAVAFAVGCETYAVWKPIKEASQTVEVPVEVWHDSEPYIVYVGVDQDSAYITTAEDVSNIVGFHVVGYTGTVRELVIPNETTIRVGEGASLVEVTKPIIGIGAIAPNEALCFEDEEIFTGNISEAGLHNNDIIKYLEIPENVLMIKQNTFQNNTKLTKVKIKGTGSLIIVGDGAFAGCIKLTEVEMTRGISGNTSSIFYGTPYTYVPPEEPPPPEP
jgi:hypothetical protein